LKESKKILDHFAFNLIKERREDPELSKKTDVLSFYIQSTKEDDEYLRDVIMNFMIAGRDTTGQTLSCILIAIFVYFFRVLLFARSTSSCRKEIDGRN
jgi:cytochrome P450